MDVHLGFEVLALDRIGTAFRRVVTGESNRMVLDGAVVDGLDDRTYSLGEIEALLLAPATPNKIVDAVWTHLVGRARVEADWMLVCVGLGALSLRRIAARIIANTSADPAEVNSELVCGFLEAVARIDTPSSGVFRRLRAAAEATTLKLVRADRLAADAREHPSVSCAPPQLCRHPDVVLARAVAAYVITPGEADLIGATRLEGLPVAEAAKAAGVTVQAVHQRRWRAEHRLVTWLTGQKTLGRDRTPANPSMAV